MEIELVNWSADMSEDLSRIFTKMNRKYTTNRLPVHFEIEDAQKKIAEFSKEEGKSGIYRAIVYLGSVIGEISIEKMSDVSEKNSEIGYALLEEYWSNGIMTKAVERIVKIAFDQIDIERITALVQSPNTASRRVLEKNGFILEGNMKKAVYKDGEYRDLLIYGKLK